MKKVGLSLICGLFMINAQANPSLCGYHDYFRLSNDSPVGTYIGFASADEDLYVTTMSSTSFLVQDTPACLTGFATAYIELQGDPDSRCILRIKDGPFIRHPVIEASCAGHLNFISNTYEGTGTRTYSMRFGYV